MARHESLSGLSTASLGAKRGTLRRLSGGLSQGEASAGEGGMSIARRCACGLPAMPDWVMMIEEQRSLKA